MMTTEAIAPYATNLRTRPRPAARGKFIYVGDEKLYLRGVTYGTFRPDANGDQYPEPEAAEHDFAQMVKHGINALRTYTVPPHWLLDLAARYGLYVMVGLPWEQHVAFLEKRRARSIEQRVQAGARACAGHPALLCFTIGNEIPASIVRWYGPRRIERFLKRLYRAVKDEDPGALVTYVNYPTTEYLDLSFVDIVAFNVYLEQQDRLEAYLARLQNLAGERPLLMAEIGLDSRARGELVQADTLDWQIRTAFEAGCAGTFVFAWTDEWYRGGQEIVDWDFGLTTRDRRPKPALAAVRQAYAEVPFPAELEWPRISVVVCSYNGARTIRECCKALLKINYPDYEVIVVDDGSIDLTAQIVREFLDDRRLRLISTENLGLSNARNRGAEAATGEIVAYIDDDAYPDPQWLTYLAATFMRTSFAAVGGPNISPPGDGVVAECIANAPGNPSHILLSDREAEHIPGCNMAIRKACLQTIGGFDPQFRVAGDDVDICWRLQQQGWSIGFSPAAMVWHHRRNTVREFLRQQRGYAEAEALLEKKWPEKYNGAGQVGWTGRVYGRGLAQRFGWHRWRIYHGIWGSAPFQPAYERTPSLISFLPLMPDWYLLLVLFAALTLLGSLWRPLLFGALPLLLGGLGISFGQAYLGATQASFTSSLPSSSARLKAYVLTGTLHMLQPIARLYGRVRRGLTLWRRGAVLGLALPLPHSRTIWSVRWRAPELWLHDLDGDLRRAGVTVRRGGDFEHWDLEVRGGMFATTRTRMMIEEHGEGQQLVHFRTWLRFERVGLILLLLLVLLAGVSVLDHASTAAVFLAMLVFALVRMLFECSTSTAALLHAIGAAARVAEQIRPESNQRAMAREAANGRGEQHEIAASSSARRVMRVQSGDIFHDSHRTSTSAFCIQYDSHAADDVGVDR